MANNELRKIRIDINHVNPVNGYFHQWYTEVSGENETTLYAIVEYPDGTIKKKFFHEIQFLIEEEKLRPVEARIEKYVPDDNDDSDTEIVSSILGKGKYVTVTVKGFFHQYLTWRDQHSEETKALVELENGELHYILPKSIMFLDRV